MNEESYPVSAGEEAILRSARGILEALPPGVTLVAAAKGRSVEQVRAAIRAGPVSTSLLAQATVRAGAEARPLPLLEL